MKQFFQNIINILKNNKKLIIICISSFFIISFLLFSSNGIITRLSLEFQNSELTSKIELEKHLLDSVKTRFEKFKNDRTEIERIARQEYGLIKPGEKKYFILSEKKTKTEK